MNLPLTKHTALISHITRMTRINGETASKIIEAMPDNDYSYLYALIINNKRDELKQHIKPYEPTTKTA